MDSTAADREVLAEVRHVSFRYGAVPALEDVSLTIRAGDFLAVLGPNGSGKTTLLKIILGLLRPDAGEVEVLGQPPTAFAERERIGYIPQKATHIDPIFPASVEEVVSMAFFGRRSRLGLSRRDESRAVGEALALVGMEEFRRRPVAGLSGGQQQRVFIARALATKPCMLILDEPTTGVDQETKDRFFDMLDGLSREGITVVLVTHDVGIVDRHVNRVACLDGGRLAYHGEHSEFCRSGVFRRILENGHHVVSHEH